MYTNIPPADEVWQKYHDYINPALADLMRYGGLVSVETRAEGVYVWDDQGNKYIDCLGGYGVFALGHRHPKVVEAVKSWLDKIPLSSKLFLNYPETLLGEKLAEILPGDIQYSFFGNSGSEAVEGALKLARMYTGKKKIIYTDGAYHGVTMGALSATGRDVYRQPFEPLVPGFIKVPFGDADAIAHTIDEDTAAVIIEPIQGEGGIVLPPDDYLKKVRDITKEKGILLILDEVQTGMGRTGAMFASELYGVEPDIIALGKALGGGVMPIGAFSSTPEIWSAFDPFPIIHESTFGGNPLATVAAVATIDVMKEEDLPAQAKEKGKKLLDGLKELVEAYDGFVANVRGKGLMIGVEMADEGYGIPMMSFLMEEGIIVAYALNNPKVIRLEPPLIISYEEIDKVLDAWNKALKKMKSFVDSL
ncbi:aspartate aminotransferase family protein [Zhurongbacter thermophilus]